jgi:hypothetical protein
LTSTHDSFEQEQEARQGENDKGEADAQTRTQPPYHNGENRQATDRYRAAEERPKPADDKSEHDAARKERKAEPISRGRVTAAAERKQNEDRDADKT